MPFVKTLALFSFFILASSAFSQEKNFFTGVGYIQPQDYRKDNEVNPLPFGISLVPVIGYDSKKLRIYGPFISYALMTGAIGLNLNLRAAGDNYEAYDLNPRKVAVNGGASLRLYFLTLGYSSDLSNTYDGNIFTVSLGHRFVLFDRLMLMPSISRQYVNSGFTQYYYGVKADESAQIEEYSIDKAVNDIYSLNTVYVLSEIKSLALNFTHKKFDNEIAKSPTIALSSYNTVGFFYNYKF